MAEGGNNQITGSKQGLAIGPKRQKKKEKFQPITSVDFRETKNANMPSILYITTRAKRNASGDCARTMIIPLPSNRRTTELSPWYELGQYECPETGGLYFPKTGVFGLCPRTFLPPLFFCFYEESRLQDFYHIAHIHQYSTWPDSNEETPMVY